MRNTVYLYFIKYLFGLPQTFSFVDFGMDSNTFPNKSFLV